MAAKKIVLDHRNANKGTERGRHLLQRSMESYGAGRSVLADKNGKLIAGNKTYETAEKLGLKVRVIDTVGDELVVVRRTDLDLDTDRDARELAYADNRVAEVDLEWDTRQLMADLEDGVGLDGFWLAPELEELLKSTDFVAEEVDPDREAGPPPESEKQVPPDAPAAGTDERVASTATQQVVLTFSTVQAREFFEQIRFLMAQRPDGGSTITDVVKRVVDEAYRVAKQGS